MSHETSDTRTSYRHIPIWIELEFPFGFRTGLIDSIRILPFQKMQDCIKSINRWYSDEGGTEEKAQKMQQSYINRLRKKPLTIPAPARFQRSGKR